MRYVEKCVNIYDVTCTQERNKSEVKLKCETSGSGADQCVLSTDLCYVRPWIICLKGRISSQHRRRSRQCALPKEIPWKYTACLPACPPQCALLRFISRKRHQPSFLKNCFQTLRVWNFRAHIFLSSVFVQIIFMLF